MDVVSPVGPFFEVAGGLRYLDQRAKIVPVLRATTEIRFVRIQFIHIQTTTSDCLFLWHKSPGFGINDKHDILFIVKTYWGI